MIYSHPAGRSGNGRPGGASVRSDRENLTGRGMHLVRGRSLCVLASWCGDRDVSVLTKAMKEGHVDRGILLIAVDKTSSYASLDREALAKQGVGIIVARTADIEREAQEMVQSVEHATTV
jgi:hypothetical protein